MSLRFRQLQAFHAIMETGTVTGAAEQLGISQPGISNLISQLERQTRLTLFDRVRGRLVPTPQAQVLFRETDTVVRGLTHVQQAVTDLQNKQVGQLQAASPHLLSFAFMPQLIARFCRTRPDLSVSFQAQYSPKIQEWVMSGLFEVGICELPIFHDAFEIHPMQFETRLAMPRSSPLARHEELTPELLRDVPFVVMGPAHQTHRRTREAFDNAGVPWRTRVHTHLSHNLLSFVKEGMGVALIDPFTLAFDTGEPVVTRPFRPMVTLDMAVITSSSRPLSAVGEAFLRDVLREMAAFAI